MSGLTVYKTCFVPLCGNTSIKTPNKKFFQMSANDKIRKKWFESARRSTPGKWKYFCCEDHFNVSILLILYMYVFI